MKSRTLRNLIIALVALPLTSAVRAQDGDIYARLQQYTYAGNSSVLDSATSLVTTARGNDAMRRQVAAGLATVLTSNASIEAKQFTCRQLAFIAGDEQVTTIASLLPNTALCHYALMALSRVGDRKVQDEIVAHIGELEGRNKIEALALLADHDDSRAIAPLTALLSSAGESDIEAVTNALARISDPAATAALVNGLSARKGLAKLPFGYALIKAGYRARSRNDTAGAAKIFSMLDSTDLSPQIRAAALRGECLSSSTPAVLIIKALGEDGTARQTMAADLVRETPGAETTRALAASLPTLTSKGKLLLLIALGDRGDHAASAGVVALCSSPDIQVRVAAIHALGQIGEPSAISLLLEMAANGSATDKGKLAARESIAKLKGNGIDDGLEKLLANPQLPEPIVIETILALSNRHAASAGRELYLRSADVHPAVRTAALTCIRDTGGFELLRPMISRTLSLPPDSRDSAIEATTEIARRCTLEAQRTGDLLNALHHAAKTEDRLTLLTILDQVGGPHALTSLETSLSDSASSVQDGALALLAEWPTDEPLNILLKSLKSPGTARRKTIALRGCLRMIGLNDQRPPDQTLSLLKDLVSLTTRPEDRRQALSGLGKLRTYQALVYAAKFTTEPSVRAEAETAIVDISRSTIGAYPEETKALLEPIARAGTEDEARKHAGEVLALPAKAVGFVTAWEVSPAYQKDGVDYKALFDMPFPPEASGKAAETPWRLMPIATNAEQPWLLDLLGLWGGEQKVAYLRTAVKAEQDRDVTLELGSDDGIKVWLNGQVVFANNTARAAAPGEERVPVHLKAGWNTLMLKVTQNIMGWGACCKIVEKDGAVATGLQYHVVSALP